MLWADIVRILAIYFIIVIHVITVNTSISTDFILLIELTLIHTCVPLFVMLSGALLLGKKESYQTFFRKRIFRVFLPWLTWTGIFTIISVAYKNNYSLSNILHTFHIIFFPFFWFLPMLFALYMLTPALRIFVQRAKTRDILFLIILWFLGTSIIPYVRNTEAFPIVVDNGILRQVVEYIGYFLLGFWMIKLPLQKKHLRLLVILFFSGILFTIGVSYFQAMGNSGKVVGNFYDYRAPGIVLVTAALFGMIYLTEKYFQRAFNAHGKKAIVAVSNASFGIYFIHYLFLNRSPLPALIETTHLIVVSSDIDFILNGTILFIISFISIFCLQKLRCLKRIIG